MNTCPRCNGKGNITYYGHIAGGVCFKCEGLGKVKAVRQRPIKAKPLSQMIKIEALCWGRPMAEGDITAAYLAHTGLTREQIAELRKLWGEGVREVLREEWGKVGA